MITNILYNLSGSLCGYFSFIHPLPEKLSIKHRSIILCYLVLTTTFFELLLGQFVAYISFAGAVVLIGLFSDNRSLCVLCSMFGYLFSVGFNHVYMWLFEMISRKSIEQSLMNANSALGLGFTYCLICYVFTKLLGYCLNKKLKVSQVFTDKHLLQAVTVLLLFITALFIFNFSYGDKLGYSYGVITFNGTIFLLVFIMTVFLMYYVYAAVQKEERAKSITAQFESLEQYTASLEKSYAALRSFKHDYLNILTTMSGYLREEDYNSLEHYFNEKILPLGQQIRDSDSRIGLLAAIHVPEVKSLASSKLTYAMGVGIAVSIDITDAVDSIPMEIIDFVRVLGIFLDNGVEAALECENRQLDFSMFYKDSQLNLVIRNSALPPKLPISRLWEWGLSSKGANRGLGLFQVSQILERYPQVIWDTEYQEPFFTQRLIFPPQ